VSVAMTTLSGVMSAPPLVSRLPFTVCPGKTETP